MTRSIIRVALIITLFSILLGCGAEDKEDRVRIIEVDKPVECEPEVKVVNKEVTKEVTKYVTIEKKLRLNRKRIIRYTCRKHPNKKRCKRNLNRILDNGGR